MSQGGIHHLFLQIRAQMEGQNHFEALYSSAITLAAIGMSNFNPIVFFVKVEAEPTITHRWIKIKNKNKKVIMMPLRH